MRDSGQAVVSKILVIDDDPGIAPLLTTLLKPQGFVVYNALNGKDGLKIAYEIHPHLIILDIMMPESADGMSVRVYESSRMSRY